jgi:hypothetical protein
MLPVHSTCKITIRGAFDERWTEYLGDVVLDVDINEGQVRTVTLLGQPPDLSAFIGMLTFFSDLGFPLIACEYQEAGAFELPTTYAGTCA